MFHFKVQETVEPQIIVKVEWGELNAGRADSVAGLFFVSTSQNGVAIRPGDRGELLAGINGSENLDAIVAAARTRRYDGSVESESEFHPSVLCKAAAMRWFRLATTRTILSRAAVLALAGWFVVAHLPLSLSLPAANPLGKDLSTPFPCQDRACGCRSAAICKKQCCCFTKRQKLAWAEKNGVDPATIIENVAPQPPTETADCRGGNCHRAAERTTLPAVAAAKDSESQASDVILLSALQRCRGASDWWCGLPVVIVPPSAEMQVSWDLRPDSLALTSELAPFCELEPPTPPPKV